MVGGQPNKIVAIIQARMRSTRLPGKVLMPIPITSSVPIIGRIINQLKESKNNMDVFVATSSLKADDKLAEFALKYGVELYRGDELDVHSRFDDILRNSGYSVAIRLTGDNPILDVDCLDKVILNHMNNGADYSYTKDLPLGMNFEIFNVEAFLKMRDLKLTENEKEHVTLKFKSSESFSVQCIETSTDTQHFVRATIDYPSDYLVVSTLFQISADLGVKIGLDVINYSLSNFPWIFEINEHNYQKNSV